MSETKKIYRVIASVQGAMCEEGISKDKKSQGFSYRGIDDVYAALAPLLKAHGLVISPEVEEYRTEPRKTSGGKDCYYSYIKMKYTLAAVEDGSEICAVVCGEAMDMGDKSLGKAMSYAYKGMAFQVFCIPVEGQEDPDAHTEGLKHKEAPSSNVQEEKNGEITWQEIIAKIQESKALPHLQNIWKKYGKEIASFEGSEEFGKINMAKDIKKEELKEAL